MKKIVNLSQVLKEFFNETAEAVSLETGFIKRKRISFNIDKAIKVYNIK